MNRNLLTPILFASLLISQASLFAQPVKPAPQLGKNSVKEIVDAMTIEEKARLVVGNGMKMPGATGPVVGRTEEKVVGAAGTTAPIPRLGIPSIVMADGPAGVRIDPFRNKDSSKSFYATAWPIATLLASSWDTILLKKVGVAFGSEARDYGIDIILAPGLNIHRNPLGGRNFEYYSEDPILTGFLTAAIVNGIESNGVGTCIKHFAANNQETNRNTINTILSERASREIYLKGFEIAVKRSQPWTLMSSYNKINGTYTSEDYGLLTSILRKEWKFRGAVMTDWFGGVDPVAQMRAGNDLIMPGTPQLMQRIKDAVVSGSLPVAVLNENVTRILNLILQTQSFKKRSFSDKPDLITNAATAGMAASESMVLLQNYNTLPFKNAKKIMLFGNASYDLIPGGSGSGEVNKAYTTSIVQGLETTAFILDDSLRQLYTKHITEHKLKNPKRSFVEEMVTPRPPIPEPTVPEKWINSKSESGDIAVITISRIAGENFDRKVENDFNLTSTEQQLIKNVSQAFHRKGKKVVVVLNIGGVIEVASWRDQVDAILLAWQPGLEGGNAIADILAGRVNPSGKLAMTFPIKYADVPSVNSFPGTQDLTRATGEGMSRRVPAEVTYDEGIYVGYRYYNTFNVKPAYEFGYGLSYTDFNYSSISLSSNNFKDKVRVKLTVTNSGNTSGKEVVQLYLTSPATSLHKPVSELKGFGKTALLKPGQSETMTFELLSTDLASFDTKASAWIAEAGMYTIMIGSSSVNIKQRATFQLANNIVVEKVNKVLVPEVMVKEIQPVKK